MKFYLVIVVFLVFDVELALVLPLPLYYRASASSLKLIVLPLVAMLAYGLILEYLQGSLH